MQSAFLPFWSSQAILVDGIDSRFAGTLISRVKGLESWLALQETILVSHAENPTIQSAIYRFDAAWREYGSNAPDGLTEAYVTTNPHPAGQRHLLDAPDGTQQYHRMHRRYHPYLRGLMEKGRYHDVFLVNPEGNVIYSTAKESDFTTNLRSGPFQDSLLGQAFRDVINAEFGTVVFTDFSEYVARNDQPAAFFATPVPDRTGKTAGVLVVQTIPDVLDPIMHVPDEISGKSRTTLIGADGRTRSGSQQEAGMPKLEPVEVTPEIAAAFDGQGLKIGTEIGADGREKLISLRPVSSLGHTWVVKAEADREQAMAPVTRLRNTLMLIATAILAATVLLGLWLSRVLTAPLTRIQNRVAGLTQGDLETSVPMTGRRDEFGHLSSDLEKAAGQPAKGG